MKNSTVETTIESLPKAAPEGSKSITKPRQVIWQSPLRIKLKTLTLRQHCSTVMDQTGKHRVFLRLLHLLLATPGFLDKEKLPLLLYSLSRVITKVEKVLNSNDL